MKSNSSSDPFIIACDREQYSQFLYGESNRERLAEVKRVLLTVMKDVLTEGQREMTVMYYFRKMSVTDIAKSRGVNKSTVSRTLARSRARIERVLKYWFSGQ